MVAAANLEDEPALVAALAPVPDVVVAARCVDGEQLLHSVTSQPAHTVLVSAGLPQLSRRVLDEARRTGARVLGIGTQGTNSLDLECIDISNGFDTLLDRVREEVPSAAGGVWSVPAAPAVVAPLVAVWGPTGAPGRTTIAMALAAELAQAQRVLLVDADPFGGAIAMNLGVQEDASGIAIACTQALRNALTVDAMRRIPRAIDANLAIVSGINQARRWPELALIDRVWEMCRELSDVVIADVGFCLEDVDDFGRRTQSTLATLAAAEHVVAVGSAEPVGLLRLLQSLEDLGQLAPNAEVHVVINKVRKGVLSETSIRQACQAAGVTQSVTCVPYDDAACASALASGTLLSARSSVRNSLRRLAASLGVDRDG